MREKFPGFDYFYLRDKRLFIIISPR